MIAPLVAHSHGIQIPDHIRDILDPRKHWLTTSQASVELIRAETTTEWRTATLLFLLRMVSNIYGALRLLFVWLPLFLLFNLTYHLLMFFPVGISILLLFIKTERVEVTPRVVFRLCSWHYTLTHFIRQYFVRMLPYYRKFPIKSWFFLSPASFFLLVFVLLIFSPFFTIAFTLTAIFESLQPTQLHPVLHTFLPSTLHIPEAIATPAWSLSPSSVLLLEEYTASDGTSPSRPILKDLFGDSHLW